MDREIERETARPEGAGLDIAASGSFLEALAGIAAIVLGILGLVGIVSEVLAAIGTIVVGAALMVQGAAVMSGYSQMLSEVGEDEARRIGAGGGMSVEFLGGISGIVLGILALINVHPRPLMSIALIVFGGTLMLSAGSISQLGAMRLPRDGATGMSSMLARQMAAASANAQVLLGISVGILGILALLGRPHQISLILVGLMVAGAATLLSGSALGTRITSLLRR